MAPQATVTLKAIDEATATINNVAREFNGLQNSIERFAVSAQRLVVGGAIVGGAIAGIRGLVDGGLAYGKELDDMARKTGQSTDEIQQLSFIAVSTGTSVEGLSISMLKIAEHTQKTGETFLQAVERISEMKNATDRTAEAHKLFGKGAGEVLKIINEGPGAVKRLNDEYEKMGGGLSKEVIEKLNEAKIAQEQANFAWKTGAANLTVTLAPAINVVAVAFAWAAKEARAFFAVKSENSDDDIKKTALLASKKEIEDEIQYLKQNRGMLGLSVAEMHERVALKNLSIARIEKDINGIEGPGPTKPEDKEAGNDAKRQHEEEIRQLMEDYDIKNNLERNELEAHQKYADKVGRIDAELAESKQELANIEEDESRREIAAINRKQEAEQRAENQRMADQEQNTHAGIALGGLVAQAAATNAKDKKVAALMEVSAQEGVALAYAWSAAMQDYTQTGVYSKIIAAGIATAAAAINTAIAIEDINKYEAGGNYPAGQRRITGERGWEMDVPGQSGYVYTHDESTKIANNQRSTNLTLVMQGAGSNNEMRANMRTGSHDGFIRAFYERASKLGLN